MISKTGPTLISIPEKSWTGKNKKNRESLTGVRRPMLKSYISKEDGDKNGNQGQPSFLPCTFGQLNFSIIFLAGQSSCDESGTELQEGRGALSPGGKTQFSRESLVSRKKFRRVPSQTFTGFYLISYSEHVLVCQKFCYGWTTDKKLFWAIHRVILGFSPLSAVESQLGNLHWSQWVWTVSHVQSSYLDSHEPNNSNQPWKIKGWDRMKEMVETHIEWVYLYKKK